MNELLFEAYSAPSVSYGIDSLFAYRHNGGRSGLVVSPSHSSTHVIPVLEYKGQLAHATRLNWGGAQSIEYMMKLLKLKYPTFPGKVSEAHIEDIIRKHCYVARDYGRELDQYLEWTGLEDRDTIIQYPYTEHIVQEKTEEELAKIAERKKESGRRLQEQAAKMRLEKLIKKEQELEYYKQLQTRLASETKKETKRLLDDEELRDEAHLERLIRDLERSIKRSRNRDLGTDETDQQNPEEMTFPLLDIPDDQLDEAGLKEKRHQRLMKSNIEARQRAKEEKEREAARIAEEQRLDDEKRETDLESWLSERRAQRTAILAKIKERTRLKSDLGNRKSLASQMRMKTLASLASDGPRKRRRGGTTEENDTFGANDEDWGVYRTVQIGDATANSDDEDEDQSLESTLQTLEAQLLQYDPDFTENNTLAAQSDWSKSLFHMFVRGPWPFDAESNREANQLHLNVERIRVPEVVFDPAIAGLDQAGLVEIAADILTQRFSRSPGAQEALLKDVFLTGGNSTFRNFEERFREEFRSVLPADINGVKLTLNVRRARDPVLDAWRGAAGWAGGMLGSGKTGWEGVSVTREEWMEMGGEYIKVCSFRLLRAGLFILCGCVLMVCDVVRNMDWATRAEVEDCSFMG